MKSGDNWFIYLITDEVGNCKVGIAKDPFKRLRALKIGSPSPLSILFVLFVGGRQKALKVESMVHEELGKIKRRNGEWFFLSQFELKTLVIICLKYIDTIKDIKPTDQQPLKKIVANEPTDDKDLVVRAKKIIVVEKRASASLLQRKLSIGYARAARIMDHLESQGVVSGLNGNASRRVLIK